MLTFKRGSGSFDVDAAGNEVESSTAFVVRAAVREVKDATEQSAPGVGSFTVYLEGRSVQPLTLPKWISTQNSAAAELKDLATGASQYGEFRFIPVPQNRFPGVTAAMGSYIKGMFAVKGRV